MALPRGWRASETPAYPGVLLWLNRTKPPGQLLLTVEDVGADARRCWPKDASDGGVACRDEATASAFLCVLRFRLARAGFALGPIEEGRWFDFEDRTNPRRFLRQGVVVGGDHAFSLILAAPTTGDRATHGRAFERSLRALRPTGTAAEEAAAIVDGGAPAPTDDGGARDAGTASDDGGLPDAREAASVVPCPR